MANPAPPWPFSQNPLNQNNAGVVGDWACKEGSGTTLTDLSTNSNNGTFSGGPTWNSGGLYGYCISAAAGSEKIACASAAGLPTGSSAPFSIGFGQFTNSYVSLSQVFGFGNALPTGGAGQNGQGRYVLQFNNNYYFWGFNADWDTGVAWDVGSWHRVWFVFDGTNLYFYRDGQLAAGPGSVSPNNFATAGSVITAFSQHSSGASSPNMLLDGCVIYGSAINLAEIKQDYADWFARFRAISPIQFSTLGSGTAVTTKATSFGTTQPTVGDAVSVRVWGLYAGVLGTPTLADNQTGNSYGSPVSYTQDSVTGEFSGIWLLPAIIGSSGTFTITVTLPHACIVNIQATEWNPGLTADQNSSATGTGTSPNPGSVTTTAANEVIESVFASTDTTNPATITQPSGFYVTGQQLSGGLGGQVVGATAYEVVSATQTDNGAWATTNGGSPRWAAAKATFYVASGGNNYTATGADSPTSSDTCSRIFIGGRLPTDSPTCSDTATRLSTCFRSITDSPSSSDTAIRLGVFSRSTSDSPSSTDSLLQTGGVARTATDSPESSDSVASSQVLVRFSADSPTSSDIPGRDGVFARLGTDAPSSSDIAASLHVAYVYAVDSPYSSDAVSRVFVGARESTESLSSSDLAVGVFSGSQILVWADRVHQTSTTIGTGPLTLSGTPIAKRSFASIMDTGDCVYGVAASQTVNEWEVNLFTMQSDGTLARGDIPLSSSNADSLVAFSGSLLDVMLDLPALVVFNTVSTPGFTPVLR